MLNFHGEILKNAVMAAITLERLRKMLNCGAPHKLVLDRPDLKSQYSFVRQ